MQNKNLNVAQFGPELNLPVDIKSSHLIAEYFSLLKGYSNVG